MKAFPGDDLYLFSKEVSKVAAVKDEEGRGEEGNLKDV